MFVKEEEEEEEEAKVDLMVVHMEYFVVTEAKKQKGYQVQIQNCNENSRSFTSIVNQMIISYTEIIA